MNHAHDGDGTNRADGSYWKKTHVGNHARQDGPMRRHIEHLLDGAGRNQRTGKRNHRRVAFSDRLTLFNQGRDGPMRARRGPDTNPKRLKRTTASRMEHFVSTRTMEIGHTDGHGRGETESRDVETQPRTGTASMTRPRHKGEMTE
ncbi:hypothetical protein AVEN_159731-1 [Araneus ventricosus]|uniref:Uncharacterized protein n=1 Tax=Araneus ventricosus TaxID=182803 RepID=A0A4Y2JTT7_ARAVE|nr:hypothetical protein AVEN_159731-1 [Araneus ventricosus]